MADSNTEDLATNASTTEKKKKKPRYSRAKKRQLQQEKLEREEQERKLKRAKKRQRRKASKQQQDDDLPKDQIDRILECAKESLFTDSILVENSLLGEIQDKGNGDATNQRQLTVEIQSGCDLSGCDHETGDPTKPRVPLSSPSSTTLRCTIKVQPLLVLDINGILCHRYRESKEEDFLESLQARFHDNDKDKSTLPAVLSSWKMRDSIGTVAETPIVPRTDLLEFLRYLDQHFCLAIWTSAQTKTAKKLLNLLLTGDRSRDYNKNDGGIGSRLLFVWGQPQCTRNKDENGETIFEKHLPKIWEAYPLWSAHNTLLMDDSPEKCPLAIPNTVHPPPLHGRNNNNNNNNNNNTTSNDSKSDDKEDSCFLLSDQDNQDRQTAFFRNLVSFWTRHPYQGQPSTCTADERCHHAAKTGDMTNTPYYNFLQTHARGFMGWRGE